MFGPGRGWGLIHGVLSSGITMTGGTGEGADAV